jgi:hypothetical protein
LDQLKKEGYQFKTQTETGKNRFNEPVTYKRYYLDDIESKNMEHIPNIF